MARNRLCLADGAGAPDALAQRFFATRGGLFGLADAAAELRLMDSRTDELGITRLSYQQVYRGVPVFAGVLRAHFDPSGELVAVNGTFVPDIIVGTLPLIKAERAAQTAIQHASMSDPEKPAQGTGRLAVVSSNVVVFRAGLVKGEPGTSHLAYRVEVSNGGDIHSDVFVDAVSGKYLDAYSRVMDALTRRSFDGAGSATAPGPNYPGTPFWGPHW